MSNDLISRSELKRAFALLMWKEHNPYDAVKVCDIVNQTLDFIDIAPTVEPKKGYWIDVFTSPGMVQCLNCGVVLSEAENVAVNFNFCPNCGADMRNGDRE